MIQFTNTINPRKSAWVLGGIAVYLALQSLITEYWVESVLSSEIDSMMISLLDLFSVNLEMSIPTWYATILLFVCAGLLGWITAVKHHQNDPYTRHWLGLSVIFLYLSIDEGAAIHEMFSEPLETALNTSGYLTFPWLIVFVPLVIVFGLLYLRFLFHLSPQIRNLVIFAALLYVGGAVVVEAVSANRWYLDGGVSFPYLAIATVEELLEMLGVVLFLYALLLVVREVGVTAVFQVTQPTQPAFRGRLVGIVIAIIVLINVGLGSWVYRQPSVLADVGGEIRPFYQEVADRYAGQGVIILQINEPIMQENPAAQQYAASLLTLFDDLLIVSLPQQQSSIVFASQSLPFDQNELTAIMQSQGDLHAIILDTSTVIAVRDDR